ncbi:hypothetical protein C8T65DRAFT_710028 [Cerioporus squamosus]|nr:hypothetical protein C8T65DRAFT_710028 [Cerioporus squamosus]
MSRPLTLHVSALNDAEYTTYTASIHDIVEADAAHAPDYDKLAVGVREARAWLRGRYPALAPSTLDSVHVLTAGQFFAALRLVSHVLGGREMDPSLVFIQAHPDELASRSPSPNGKRSRVSSPVGNPFSRNGATNPPVRPPPPSLPPKPTNPFLNRRGSQDVTPHSAPAGTAVFPNGRANNTQDTKIPPLARTSASCPAFPHASRSVSTSTSNTLIQQSLQATRIAQSLKKAEQKLEQERVLEVLKSSSAPLRRMRSKSPTKSPSSSTSSISASGSGERTVTHRRVPSLPPRRNLSPPASTQVANATLSPFKRATMSATGVTPSSLPPEPPMRRFASPSNSPSRTPPRPLSDLPPDPPPTHPDRKSIAMSVDTDRFAPCNASPRVGRSKSLHHPSPPPRPESAQLTPTSSPFESPFASPPGPESGSSTPSNLMLSRHLSLSSTRQRERERDQQQERERGRDAFADTLQKTFTSLQLRAQPALYKAEGAFSRRGFVQHGHGHGWTRAEGERGLMDDGDQDSVDERARRWREGGVDVTVVDREEGLARGGSGRRMVLERDDLKWPAGDGWKPL